MRSLLRSPLTSHATTFGLAVATLLAIQAQGQPAPTHANAPENVDTLTVARLVIEDGKNQGSRAVLGRLDEVGGFGFVFKDRNDQSRLSYRQSQPGSAASLQMHDADGVGRIVLEVAPEHGEGPPTSVGLLDAQGRRRAMITVGKAGEASVDLLGADPDGDHVLVRLDEQARPTLAMVRNGKPFAFTISYTAENKAECVLFEDGEKMHRIVRD